MVIQEIGELMAEYQGVRDAFVLILGSGISATEERPSLAMNLRAHLAEWWRSEHPEAAELAEEEFWPELEAAIDSSPEPQKRGFELAQEAIKDEGMAEGYAKLARIITRGYCALVFTFDPTDKLEEALKAERLLPGEAYNLFVVGHHPRSEIVKALSESEKVTLIKMGGDLANQLLPVTTRSIEHNVAQVRSTLHRLSRHNTLLVSITERDMPVVSAISAHGERLWWVNRKVPIIDAKHFERLKIEQPAALEYHAYLPQVVSLLKTRNSSGRLLCRESGTFQAFANALYNRLVRYSSRATFASPRKKDLKILPEGPYKFLHSFELADRELYYGRDNELREFRDFLADEEKRLWLLIGRGGAGKTSFVKAGLLPKFIEDEQPYLYVRYEENLLEAFARAIREDLGFEPEPSESIAEMVLAAAKQVDKRCIVFFDQYEHVMLRLGPASRDWLNAEFEQLVKAEEANITLVLMFRERFMARLDEARNHLPQVFEHIYRLPFLSFDGARSAITKPAGRFGIGFEADLVEQIIVDVSGEGVDPPKLQIVCGKLFQELENKQELATRALYQKLGGADKIVGQYLDESLKKLKGRERRLGIAVLKALAGSFNTTIGITFERLQLEARAKADQMERVLLHLHDAGLVRRVGNPQERRYELTHERIVDDIYKSLSPEEILAKQLRDLLVRSERDWQRYNSLMSADSVAVIHRHRRELEFEPDQLELLVRSSMTTGVAVRYWAQKALELGDRGAAILEEMLPKASEATRVRLAGALKESKSPRTLRLLLSELTERGGPSEEEVLASLKEQLPQLHKLLEETDEETVARAADALARLQDKTAVTDIIKALKRTELESTHRKLLRAYERILGEKAADQLVQELQKASASEQLALAIRMARASARHKLIEALQKAKDTRSEGAIQLVLGLLRVDQKQYTAARDHLQAALRVLPALEQMEEFRISYQLALTPPEPEELLQETFWVASRGGPRGHGALPSKLKAPLEQSWIFNAPAMVITDPLVAEGLVVIGCASGQVLACDAQTGAKVWEAKAGQSLTATGAYSEGHYYFASQEGEVFRFEVNDGDSKRMLDLKRELRAPLLAHAGKLLLPDWQGTLHCINLATGEPTWQFSAGSRLLAQPVLQGDTCYIGSWDQHLYAIALETGELRWRFRTGSEIYSAAAVVDDLIYTGSDDGVLYCLASSSGEVIWERQLGSALRASPCYMAGQLLVATGKGEVMALDAGSGETSWSQEVGDEILASPVLSEGWAYVGAMNGSFYAFRLEDGEQVTLFDTAYGIQQSAAVGEDHIYVPSRYYDLTAFAGQEED